MTTPAPGSWHRWAVIRGDLAAVGLLSLVGGTIVAGASLLAVLPAWAVVPGLVVAALGALAMVHARAAWLGLVEEVRDRHADDDPGSSPVAWVDDGVWRQRNGFDPALDAPMILRAEVEPELRVYPRDVGPAIREPVLRPVSDAEQSLATEEPVADGLPVPSAGDRAALLRALEEETEGRFLVLAPRWPVCCGRLSTLVALTADPHDGSLFLPAGSHADADPHGPIGQHTFQCRACGRRYRTEPAW